MRTKSRGTESVQRWSALSWAALLGVLLLRIALARALPLTGDEAYFWEWSRHPALGYHDHPPLVAWAILASTTLLGSTELGVRGPALLALAACVWVLGRLARDLAEPLGLDPRAAERMVAEVRLLALAVPIFAFFGLYASGDSLVLLSWAVALRLGWHAWRSGRWRDWVGLGLAAGAGLQAKLLFLPFLPAYGLFLLATPGGRRWLRTPRPWVALAALLAINVPFLVWNAGHGWATLRFNFLGRHDLLPGWKACLELVGSQLVVLSPFVCACGVTGAGRALLRWSSAPAAERYLALLFGVPLAAYLLQSLAGLQIGAHWPAAPALSALLLVPTLSARRRRAGAERAARRLTLATLGLAALLSLAGHVALLLPSRMPRLVHPLRGSLSLSELEGWPELGRRVAELRAEQLAAPSTGAPEGFLLAAQYGFAAQASFYTPGQPPVMLWEPPRRHGQSYREWERFERLRGADALFLTKHEKYLERSLAELREHFARVEETERLSILRHGVEVRAFYLVLCRRFDGAPASFGRGERDAGDGRTGDAPPPSGPGEE